MLDCACLAGITALRHFRRPDVEVIGEEVIVVRFFFLGYSFLRLSLTTYMIDLDTTALSILPCTNPSFPPPHPPLPLLRLLRHILLVRVLFQSEPNLFPITCPPPPRPYPPRTVPQHRHNLPGPKCPARAMRTPESGGHTVGYN